MWCTDISYHMKHAPKVRCAGWMAYCAKTDNSMTGNFYEMLEDTGSYSKERLGLCAIHHLITALYELYNIHDWHTKINCDNMIL